MFAAILRASSFVRSFAAERHPGLLGPDVKVAAPVLLVPPASPRINAATFGF